MEQAKVTESPYSKADGLIFVGAAALLLAGSLGVVRLAEGPKDCVQPTDDIAPAVNFVGCIEDLTGINL